jgi:hypothetical protein
MTHRDNRKMTRTSGFAALIFEAYQIDFSNSYNLLSWQVNSVALQAGAARRLGGEVLQDCLFQLDGAGSIPGADGGFEFPEQVGKRALWVGGCRHGDEVPLIYFFASAACRACSRK